MIMAGPSEPIQNPDHSGRAGSEQMLWRQFLDELSRFGQVSARDDGYILFVAHEESEPRTFAIGPTQLHDTVTAEIRSYARGSEEVAELPQWLIDDLWEMIGSREEPFECPYVGLDNRGNLVEGRTLDDVTWTRPEAP
jgi:hypothetical protein